MANNCLVTKLKARVDNDNLPIFGYQKISLYCTSEVTAPCNEMYLTDAFLSSDSAYFIQNGQNIGNRTTTGATQIHIPSGITYLYIKDNSCVGPDFIMSPFVTAGIIATLEIASIKYLLSVTPGSFVLSNILKGKLSDFGFLDGVLRFNVGIGDTYHVSGNISELPIVGQYALLTGFPDVQGNIEDYLDKLGTTVRSKTIKLRFTNVPNIKYNNISIGAEQWDKDFVFDANGAWSEAS